MVAALLLALLGSAHAVAVEPGPHAAYGPPRGDAYAEVAILPAGPLDVDGIGSVSLRGPDGVWAKSVSLPARLAPRSAGPHALRFRLAVPDEPATMHVRIADAEGGILLPIRVAPERGPPPPLPEDVPRDPETPLTVPLPPNDPPGAPPATGGGQASSGSGGSPAPAGGSAPPADGAPRGIPAAWGLAALPAAGLARRRD